MKLTNHEWLRAGRWMGLLSMAIGLMGIGLGREAQAQSVTTTTVQGTVYLANGQPGSGTLVLSWPSFTTANGQLVTADSTTVTIAPDGFLSVNLAPNQGSTPAGQYYTAVYYMSDGIDKHSILGGSHGGSGDAGTGAGTTDAGNSGGADGEPKRMSIRRSRRFHAAC